MRPTPRRSPKPATSRRRSIATRLHSSKRSRRQYVSEDTISMVEAINRGLREELERNPKIVMWGEDIADPKGGVFGVTRGLTNLYPGSRSELAAGRSQHRRRCRRNGDRRLQADRRDPVCRLFVAGLHADAQRNPDPALAQQRRMVRSAWSSGWRAAAASKAVRSIRNASKRCMRTRRAGTSSFRAMPRTPKA